MKTYFGICLTAAFLLINVGFLHGAPGVASQPAPVQTMDVPAPTPYAVTTRDGNSSVWERTVYELGPSGQVVPKKHHYTELATGLNHLVNGQWVESKEEIDISADGNSAAATNGQHQAYFPGDIYSGQIELVTSDGKHLYSRPVGLSYFDGQNSVLIAELTNSTGQVLPSGNQVVYANAFTDFKADLRYTYTKAGFEQDIILREQPPTPASFGLNPDTTRLQVLTEFFDPPQPTVNATTVSTAAGDLENDDLNFGSMAMVPGKAFLLGTNSPLVGVDKQWLVLDGRQMLVEELPVSSIADGLESLPLPQTASTQSKPPLNVVSAKRLLPEQRLATNPGKHPMQLAQATPASHGLVLDYQTINSSVTDYTFRGDTTYYISGTVYLDGTNNIFEGGAVIKTMNYYSAGISLDNSALINCQGTTYRPTVFTSPNDNSVGDTISGSTGTPVSGDYPMALFLGYPSPDFKSLSHVRVMYATTALDYWGHDGKVSDAQFVNCGTGIYVSTGYTNSSGYTVTVENALFSGMSYAALGFNGGNIIAENVTFDQCRYLAYNGSGQLFATNCIFADMTNASSGSLTGNLNGFYNTTEFGSNAITNTFNPFQTVGGGSYYLTNGCSFFNAGTTNIDPTLLADLRAKTTYPPIVYSNVTNTTGLTLSPQAQRDTDTPDLGYHYDPLDYAFGGCTADSNITFTAGTAVGWFRTTSGWYHAGQAIQMSGNITVAFNGTATAPTYWVRLNTVQENDQTAGYGHGSIENWAGPAIPLVSGYFLHCTAMAGEVFNGYFAGDYGMVGAAMTHSEFWGGSMSTYGDCLAHTNCLMWRVNMSLVNGNAGAYQILRDCTFIGGTFASSRISGGTTSVSVRDTAFDGTSISTSDYYGGNSSLSDYDYNAYTNSTDPFSIGGAHDVIVTNSFNWQRSWFGNYYQPTNSLLIDKGGTTADQVGLYHFTTQTNQVPETNSIVDIGYHYVATDTNGIPLDSNGDGIPDYLEDANGNGLIDSGETNWALAILTQPTNQTVIQGGNATFNVTADGIAPLCYQWWFDTTNLVAGGTNATLVLTNVQINNAGNYFVVVTNYGGLITSTLAVLTVQIPQGVSHWTFDDGAGSTAVDSGSLSNNGSLLNATWTSGEVGPYALSFTGNGYVSAGSVSSYAFIQNTKTFSLNAWIKLTDYTASGDQDIFDDSHGASGPGIYEAYHNSGGSHSLELYIMNNSGSPMTSLHYVDNVITNNNWHMVTLTGDGNVAQFYVDGIAVGSPISMTSSSTGNSQAALLIGNDNDGDGFNGTIDDPQIWTNTISLSTITNLFSTKGGGGGGGFAGNPQFTNDCWFSEYGNGVTNGNSATNTLPIAYLQNQSFWSSVPSSNLLSSGTTAHLVGTITTPIVILSNGISSSPITFLFESNSIMSAPYWNPPAINIGSMSNIVINGGANGLIIATANGSGLAYTNTSQGVVMASEASYITVQNLTISNMYVRTPGSGEGSPDGVYGALTQGILLNGSYITVFSNIINGAESAINVSSWGGGVTNNNISIYGNCFYNNCICMPIGNSGGTPNCLLYNLNISSNRFDHWSSFSAVSPGASSLHLDGIYIFLANGVGANSGTCIISNVVIANNYFGPDVLSGTNADNTSSTLFETFYATNFILPVAFNVKVYNNIFVWTNTSSTQLPWSDGFIGMSGYGNSIVANNTLITVPFSQIVYGSTYRVVGQGNAIGATFYPTKFYNNFTFNFSHQITFDPNCGLTNYVVGTDIDYNDWAKPYTGYTEDLLNEYDFFIPPATPYAGFVGMGWPTWITNVFTGFSGPFDQHSSTNTPSFNLSTYQPLTNDTVLVGMGTNLTSWGIVNDFYGNPRPTNGMWTIGAFQTPY